MFSKNYRNKKKTLNRLLYISKTGIMFFNRNTGAKSNTRFQEIIDNGDFDLQAELYEDMETFKRGCEVVEDNK